MRGCARASARDYRGLNQESRRAASHCSLPHALCVTSVLSYVELKIGNCPSFPKVAARYGLEVAVLETLSERRRWSRRARVTAAAWRRLNVGRLWSVYEIPRLQRVGAGAPRPERRIAARGPRKRLPRQCCAARLTFRVYRKPLRKRRNQSEQQEPAKGCSSRIQIQMAASSNLVLFHALLVFC